MFLSRSLKFLHDVKDIKKKKVLGDPEVIANLYYRVSVLLKLRDLQYILAETSGSPSIKLCTSLDKKMKQNIFKTDKFFSVL